MPPSFHPAPGPSTATAFPRHGDRNQPQHYLNTRSSHAEVNLEADTGQFEEIMVERRNVSTNFLTADHLLEESDTRNIDGQGLTETSWFPRCDPHVSIRASFVTQIFSFWHRTLVTDGDR